MLKIINRNSRSTQFVPLKSVNVNATIRSFAADVTITQVFRNDETTPIEAVYCFPIEEQAAIYAFVARIDDREIVAQLKEKNEAQRDYSEALQQGHGAYLMEQDEKSQDNFIINVGALPPSKECTITISYVTELDLVQGSTIRFVVPTTIAPRYNPDKGRIASPAGTNVQYVQTSPYTVEFCCRVENLGGIQIARINSSSHPIEIDFAQQDVYMVTFAQKNTHLDRDILINIELAEKRDNLIVAIEPGAVMATFMPTEEDCRRVAKIEDESNEFIFVVDCSGSMTDENKIGLARQAILLFLKSLPINCHFNIIRFGSNYTALFRETTDIYNEDNARKAEALVKTLEADLGGTVLLEPLKWLEQHPPKQGRSRQIFLLTDGEISNVTEVLDLCRSMATSTRIFSFGLGRSPSRSLVKGLARSTNGRFVFIPPNTTVDVHVGEQLQKALQPCITNVQVKWNLATAHVENVPNQSPPVYANDRLIVYGLFDDKSSSFDHNSSVELQVNQHQLSIARINRVPSVSENGTIARLAAKALILELQHAKLPAERVRVGSMQSRFQDIVEASNQTNELLILTLKETEKKRIVELSLKHKILSPHTAFIGIEKRTNGNNADMVLREVPIQISADDQHLTATPRSMNYTARRSGLYQGIPSDYGGGYTLGLDGDRRYGSRGGSKSYSAGRGGGGGAGFMPSFGDKASFKFDNSNETTLPSYNRRSRSRSRSPPILKKYLRKLSSRTPDLSSDSSNETLLAQPNSVRWPSNDQDIVRHLIDKQNFNGLWDLDTESIRYLTGKTLTDFQLVNVDVQVLVSAIILILLETRFGAFISLWHGVAQKSRKSVIDKLGQDPKNLEQLLQSVRKQL